MAEHRRDQHHDWNPRQLTHSGVIGQGIPRWSLLSAVLTLTPTLTITLTFTLQSCYSNKFVSMLSTNAGPTNSGFDTELAWEAVQKDANVPPADDLTTQVRCGPMRSEPVFHSFKNDLKTNTSNSFSMSSSQYVRGYIKFSIKFNLKLVKIFKKYYFI